MQVTTMSEEVQEEAPTVILGDMSHVQAAHSRLYRVVTLSVNFLFFSVLIALGAFIGFWIAFFFYLKVTNPLPVAPDTTPTPIHSQ